MKGLKVLELSFGNGMRVSASKFECHAIDFLVQVPLALNDLVLTNPNYGSLEPQY
jgi:hypothetical protein